jgi:UDP-N-acetylglucosamine transferase subunit ALG13
MIFVTTGTNGAPFDRLLAAVAALDLDDRLVVQHGPSSIYPRDAVAFAFLPFDDLVGYVLEAQSVICHGGVGSILVSLMNGRRPIVVPRLAAFGEAVDDHQLILGQRLDEEGLITLVTDPRDLAGALLADSRRSQPPAAEMGGTLLPELAEYVRALKRRRPVPA